MATVTLGESTVEVSGSLPRLGEPAPDFVLTSPRLADVRLDDFRGRRLVLNIFPSVDTRTCAASVRAFNQHAAALSQTTVLCVSADLPFALGRFCGSEGLDNVETASTFRNPEFLDAYGVGMTDGPMRGLCARAVVVIDQDGTVVHQELVPDIGTEPNYALALGAITGD